MVFADTNSVPLFAIWPTFIMGTQRPYSLAFYDVFVPFSAFSPRFCVPNLRRLLRDTWAPVI
jgi:hypothetical protein